MYYLKAMLFLLDQDVNMREPNNTLKTNSNVLQPSEATTKMFSPVFMDDMDEIRAAGGGLHLRTVLSF